MLSKITLGSRLILGLTFVVFGLNGLLFFVWGKSFLPMPSEISPALITIMTGFITTGYLMPLVQVIEIVAGLLLLSGFRINLALVLLGPIIVNIFGIHLFADRAALPQASTILILFLIVLQSRWQDFKALLKN